MCMSSYGLFPDREVWVLFRDQGRVADRGQKLCAKIVSSKKDVPPNGDSPFLDRSDSNGR